MSRSSRRWNWRPGIGLVMVIALFAGFPIGDRILNASRGQAYHQELLREFQAVAPLPGAAVVQTNDRYSPWRPRQGVVETTYTTTAPYPTIRRHYADELTSKGWRLLDDRPIKAWGKDLGGRVMEYCKGPIKASLQYAGSQAEYGWTFAFGLSWGIGSPKCA